MDSVFSTLFPTHRIGDDGFSWFIGQVENVNDHKNGGRVQVRIVGTHHREGDVTPTKSLPWAHVMLPANVPYADGQSSGTNNLKIGCWVVGFYLDLDHQKPLIIGSIAHTPSSTYKDLQNWSPDLESLGFKPTRVAGTTPREQINPAIHRAADEQNGKKDGEETGAVTETGEAAAKKSNQGKKVPPAIAALNAKKSDTNPTGGKVCVPVADPNCDAKDLGSGIKNIISGVLANVQSSGGRLGDYYVSKANGELYDAVNIPRKYITQTTRLVNSFGLRVKKEIFYGIRDAIEELVKLIIGVKAATETADIASDKAKNPKQSYVPNTERGNFLQEVIDTFNKILNEIGCSFKKTLDDLIKFIINLILEYLRDAFSAAFCLIDNIVNSIVTYINSAFTALVTEVLGPLQSLLGEAGSYLNIIGGVINRVLNILGISCTGPKNDCNKNKTKCSDGTSDDDDDDNNFFDNLIKEIETGSLRGTKFDSGTSGLTGISEFTRGVCDDAKQSTTKSTTVKFVGGVLNDPPETSNYVSVSKETPNIPLSIPTYPTDLPNATTNPFITKDIQDNIEYVLKARENTITAGDTAVFDLVGPERNGVLEIEYDGESYKIPGQAGEIYEPCLISSEDGQSNGLEIQVSRDDEGSAILNIKNPGRGFLPNTSFILKGSKIGGEDGSDDIPFTITKVGEVLTYRIFGDVYEKGLIDRVTYPEFLEFTYSEPTTFFIKTNDTRAEMPSYLGMDILNKRAADSVVIWDEKPKDKFPEEVFDPKFVTIETEKDTYLEGETVEYTFSTVGYPEGTVFEYTLFGSVSQEDYVDVSNGVVVISENSAKTYVLFKKDTVKENLESLSMLLYSEGKEGSPLATKTVFVTDTEEEGAQDEFTLDQNTTQQELEDYLKKKDEEDDGETDFSGFSPDLDNTLGDGDTDSGGDGPPFEPPEAGDPYVDPDGSIISVDIKDPGNGSYQVAPGIEISGDGYGAAGIVLLDDKGFVSEIRITRIGVGYAPNEPSKRGTVCVIDSFTIIRPGFGYTEPPKIFVNGDPNIAEAIVDENGFISGVNVLNRNATYETIPEIIVVGGEGAGGFVLPSLVCLPPEELETKGYVKIGTGKYIDCP